MSDHYTDVIYNDNGEFLRNDEYWIKYSIDQPTDDSDMSDSPIGASWIGIAKNSTEISLSGMMEYQPRYDSSLPIYTKYYYINDLETIQQVSLAKGQSIIILNSENIWQNYKAKVDDLLDFTDGGEVTGKIVRIKFDSEPSIQILKSLNRILIYEEPNPPTDYKAYTWTKIKDINYNTDTFDYHYEISIWKDIQSYIVRNYNNVVYVTNSLPGDFSGTIEGSFFGEQKIGVLGSDVMSTPYRAISPRLTTNVNGTSTLDFQMPHSYFDEDLGEYVTNPYENLLVNERTIKLYYKNKWYDFVLKNISEDSVSNVFEYHCNDVYINELSKNGFNLEFASDLKNNQGTVEELGAKILEGTDWTIGEDSEEILESIEEPLYLCTTKSTLYIKALNMGGNAIQLSSGSQVYVFYSERQQAPEYYFLVMYSSTGEFETNDSLVISKKIHDNYYVCDSSGNPRLGLKFDDLFTIKELSNKYRACKYICKPISKYQSLVEHNCTKYVNDDETDSIWVFTDIDYLASDTVLELAANGVDFTSTDGWFTYDQYGSYTLAPYPDVLTNPQWIYDGGLNARSFIELKFKDDEYSIRNDGFARNLRTINTFNTGDTYIVRYKAFQSKTSNTPQYLLTASIASYTINDDGTAWELTTIAPGGVATLKNGYYEIELTVGGDYHYSYSDLLQHKNIGLFVCPSQSEYSGITYIADSPIYVEDFQFFKKVTFKNKTVYPGEVPEATTITYYSGFRESDNSEAKNINEVVYEFERQTEIPSEWNIAYNRECYKVRSIEGSKTNRFNLLQTLAETFECWAKFEIEHEPNGAVAIDENTHKPSKKVTFHNYTGADNAAGFKYGINLNGIKREINSDSICTKLIVENNSNQFANNGFCSVARAENSPNKDNFFINLDYYCQHGILDFKSVNYDLYDDIDGYYPNLLRLNSEREAIVDDIANLTTELSKLNAELEVYKLKTSNLAELIGKDEEIITQPPFNSTYWEVITNPQEWFWKYELGEKLKEITDRITLNSIYYKKAAIKLENLTTEVNIKQNTLNDLEDRIENLASQKKVLDKAFNDKYYKYIQEGSWIDENYIDDDLYCIDAQSTLANSATPKISYNIQVIDVERAADYENYRFEVGEITTVEDTNFFGWSLKDGYFTPYKEEVIISSITWNLDNPESNTITVQNFKEQFKDLFQRVAAATATVEFKTGAIDRTSKAIETDGTITQTALQNALNRNGLTISNEGDDTVFWDDRGLVTEAWDSSGDMLRFTNGGLWLSRDKGQTWVNIVNGKGINTEYLDNGVIDASKISIVNGKYPCLRMDTTGLTAYSFTENEQGEIESYDSSTFVRFDQYGLYSIHNKLGFNTKDRSSSETPEKYIKDNARFSLTKEGFTLRGKDETKKYLEINSDNKIILNEYSDEERVRDYVDRITIGDISTSENPDLYGIRIKNRKNEIVMYSDSDGNLVFRDIKVEGGFDLGDTISLGDNNISSSKYLVAAGTNNLISSSENLGIFGNNNTIENSGNSLLVGNGITATDENPNIKDILYSGIFGEDISFARSSYSLILGKDFTSNNTIDSSLVLGGRYSSSSAGYIMNSMVSLYETSGYASIYHSIGTAHYNSYESKLDCEFYGSIFLSESSTIGSQMHFHSSIVSLRNVKYIPESPKTIYNSLLMIREANSGSYTDTIGEIENSIINRYGKIGNVYESLCVCYGGGLINLGYSLYSGYNSGNAVKSFTQSGFIGYMYNYKPVTINDSIIGGALNHNASADSNSILGCLAVFSSQTGFGSVYGNMTGILGTFLGTMLNGNNEYIIGSTNLTNITSSSNVILNINKSSTGTAQISNAKYSLFISDDITISSAQFSFVIGSGNTISNSSNYNFVQGNSNIITNGSSNNFVFGNSNNFSNGSNLNLVLGTGNTFNTGVNHLLVIGNGNEFANGLGTTLIVGNNLTNQSGMLKAGAILCGQYNEAVFGGQYYEMFGGGTATTPKNIRTLDGSGNQWIAGKYSMDGTPAADNDVTTVSYVSGLVSDTQLELESQISDSAETVQRDAEEYTDGRVDEIAEYAEDIVQDLQLELESYIDDSIDTIQRDSEEYTDTRIEESEQNIFNLLYPINTVYTHYSPDGQPTECPVAALGGEWNLIEPPDLMVNPPYYSWIRIS